MSTDASSQVEQVLLRLHYQDLIRRGATVPRLSDTEFRCYSQNGEDGILLYIFSILGTANRRVVEICCGDGIECNAANLIVNHGWSGLLIDGDPGLIAGGQQFYSTCRTTWVSPPRMLNAWVTAENVDGLVAGQGFSGDIDLLSIDVDGNDYWLWKALECVRPSVVVAEFNAACGPDKSMTMAYDQNYRLDVSKHPYRCGASLSAFANLARGKGYRLVGVQSLGFNAFFVRDGHGEAFLPERSPRECYAEVERLRDWSPAWLAALVDGVPVWQEV
jgi:hypothetical protein